MTNIFDSPLLTVGLSDKPSVKGHLTVENKKILKDCTEDEAILFYAATSQCATALFELLGAHGTNILIHDSPTTLRADILARMENDGIDLSWQPTRVNPNELDEIAKKIKDKADVLIWKRDNPNKAKPSSGETEKPEVIKEEVDEKTGEKKKNYMMDHLNRTP